LAIALSRELGLCHEQHQPTTRLPDGRYRLQMAPKGKGDNKLHSLITRKFIVNK
jgi:hypothetical protein